MLIKSIGMYLIGILILFIALYPRHSFAFEPNIDFNAPDWVEERESADNDIPELPRAGSLFGSGDKPLFSDRRAMKPDDLITIVISENANANFTTNKNYNGASGGNVTPPSIEYTGNNEEQKQIVSELNEIVEVEEHKREVKPSMLRLQQELSKCLITIPTSYTDAEKCL